MEKNLNSFLAPVPFYQFVLNQHQIKLQKKKKKEHIFNASQWAFPCGFVLSDRLTWM